MSMGTHEDDIIGRLKWGEWQCAACEVFERIQNTKRHDEILAEVKERHAAGKCFVHVPGGYASLDLSDEQAQQECDKHLCCSWERRSDKIIFWGEM